MSTRTQRDERERERAIQDRNPNRCYECGGGFYLPSGFVGHSPTCKKVDRAMDAALRHAGAPFPVADPGPWEDDEEPRTYFPAAAPWESDVDLGGAR